jgi:serine protein kinase
MTGDLERLLKDLSQATRDDFSRRNSVMGFSPYLKLLSAAPSSLTRIAARYVVDALDSFGTYEVKAYGQPVTRWRAFDDPGAPGETSAEVFGHEEVQERIHEILSELARRGRSDRFILLHGPNGSAKSSLIDALIRTLERYSATPAGALYRFSWIFCEGGDRDRLGFQPGKVLEDLESLADVDERLVSSRVPAELKDPPFFLIPLELRRAFFEGLLESATEEEKKKFRWTEFVLLGDLSPKSKLIYDCLLKAYGGDWKRVIRHVRVERWYVARRYRAGAVTIEPQATIDAQSRMLAHGSLTGLPPVLQHETLVEAFGDLVEANGGLVEFSDFFKRPLEASKYLLTTAERGTLNLPGYTAQLNLVMFGTTNEQYLASFKRDPAFASFKGRFELVRVPYLLEYKKEAQIYARHLAHVRGERHVAPHTATAIALWTVLTRLKRPNPGRYPAGIQAPLRRLTPLRKARLYDRADLPTDLTEEEQKLIRAEIRNLRAEYDGAEEEAEGSLDAAYEGKGGASPREILAMLSDVAVQSSRPCISPVDVFEALPGLIADKTVHSFLRVPKDGAYHDPEAFVEEVRAEYVTRLASEIQRASDVVDEAEYTRLFHEYFRHVKAFDTQQKVQNKETGKLEPPDENLMVEVERHFELKESPARFRRDLITRIAAFRLDNPEKPLVYDELFEHLFSALKQGVFAEQHQKLVRLAEDALATEAKNADHLPSDRRQAAASLLERLVKDFGYCPACRAEMLSYFLRYRDEVRRL